MLQGLAVSADEDTGYESDASMVKNVHTSQGSEDDYYGIDDAQRAFSNVDFILGDWITNVQPPTVLPFDAPQQVFSTKLLLGAGNQLISTNCS
ncbi:hypothetical protein KIN20_004813 [Parelaphostrongylus tenuis]|uniref:Uncharacterized protein n=1 Tax=Parelaphostrongylus tenuis TaxID=148309 RepID=A0AAD5QEP5_PARTN|nr:hypothetical protein KIN20_004813 [Parelaphostrongylus tenuis]